MASDPPSPAFPPQRSDEGHLPESHLAFVIEDALAAVDASSGASPLGAVDPDLRAAWLYGWATGAVTARELAQRSATDVGLRHLLRGARPSFSEVRSYREAYRPELQAVCGQVFALCRASGLTRLGRIRLPAPLLASSQPAGRTSASFVYLTRELLALSAEADLREDRELGKGAPGDEIPPPLASRRGRQRVFQELRARAEPEGQQTGDRTRWEGSPRADAAQPLTARSFQPTPVALSRMLALVATLALLFGGLFLVRWIGSATLSPAQAGPATRGGYVERVLENQLSPSPFRTPETEAREQIDRMAARDEAIRLAAQMLGADDLPSAQDLYLLALQAMPADPEATTRLRQVRTAIGIAERRAGWADALAELDELRRAVPDSAAVLQAYVASLIGAGREAVLEGDPERSQDLCSEAARWLPSRADVQSCLAPARAGETPTATPVGAARATPVALTPAPSVELGPRAPRTEALPPTAMPVGPPSSPSPLTILRRPGTPAEAPAARLQVSLSGSCRPADGARDSWVIRARGSVSSEGAPVGGYTLEASVLAPGGQTVAVAEAAYGSPVFLIQHPASQRGPHALTASVRKDGYANGAASVVVDC